MGRAPIPLSIFIESILEMTFNLPPPSSFSGIDPYRPVKIYQRNMPHWRQEGATYFVTFNLADALPLVKREKLKSMHRQWEIINRPPRDETIWANYAKVVFRKVEKWMDAGYGKCWFCNIEYAEELHRRLLHFQNQRYEVGCFVIMANHCHLVMKPFDSFDLENELGSIKSITARFINEREKGKGELWQQECYDRIIRDEEHLYRVVQYIGRNPQRAKIPAKRWFRWMNPDWEAAGWKFES